MIGLVVNPYKTSTALGVPTGYFSVWFELETIPVKYREKKLGLNMGLELVQEELNPLKTEFVGSKKHKWANKVALQRNSGQCCRLGVKNRSKIALHVMREWEAALTPEYPNQSKFCFFSSNISISCPIHTLGLL